MAFCKKCGNELKENVEFCAECGTEATAENNHRKVVFDGEIHKCPSCGEQIESFVIACSTCGYELRGAKTSSIIKELSSKLEKTISVKERCDLIRSFYIPNTKEDIFEFIILAASNIDCETEETTAWIAKLKQAYEKSKVSFKNATDFSKVEKIYNDAISAYYKKNTIKVFTCLGSGVWKVVSAIGGFIKFLFSKFFELLKKSSGFREFCGFALAILCFYLVSLSFFASKEQEYKEHMAYLEKLVEEVEVLIDDEKYDAARIKVSKIVDDTGWSSESEDKWDDIREVLEDTINKKEKESKKNKED